MTGRTGRRSGSSGTRAAVLAVAERQFAEIGYDRASMRSIAAEAEVDPKLVSYFFSSKQALFVAVTQLPFDPEQAIMHVLEGEAAERGERLARLIVGMLENPQTGPKLVGLVRAAAAEPEAARMVRELLTQRIWAPAADQLQVDRSSTGVALISTEILGLVLSRYVIRTEPLASLAAEDVVGLLAPNLQRAFDETGGDGSRR